MIMPSKYIKTAGKSVTWTRDIQTLVRDAKLDYEVIKSPIFYLHDKDTYTFKEIKNNFVCVNKSNGHYFSTVGKNYKVVSNVNAFTFLNPPTAKKIITPLYAGEVNRGAKAFIYFKDNSISLENYEIGLLAINSHDGKNGLEFMLQIYNPIFDCTLGYPLSKHLYKHVSGFDKVSLSLDDYCNVRDKGLIEIDTALTKLQKVALSDEDYRRLISKIAISKRTSAETTPYTKKAVDRVLTITRERTPQGALYTLQDVLWALNHYAEHELPKKSSEAYIVKDTDFLRNVYFSAYEFKCKVYNELLQV